MNFLGLKLSNVDWRALPESQQEHGKTKMSRNEPRNFQSMIIDVII